MPHSDYNTIKPVENLQNVGGLTPVKEQKEKKRRRNQQQDNQQEHEQKLNQSIEENSNKDNAQSQTDGHSIDYCA